MSLVKITKEFKSYKSLIESVLSENPKARNSDTILYIECCKRLGAKTLADVERLNLNIVTLHKTRQCIQNRDGMYLPSEDRAEIREERDRNIKAYMVSGKGSA